MLFPERLRKKDCRYPGLEEVWGEYFVCHVNIPDTAINCNLENGDNIFKHVCILQNFAG
jgi:hypothetical protein